MVSNQKLFSVGNFDFRLQHLLVIGVFALSVSISMMIRSTPTHMVLNYLNLILSSIIGPLNIS